MDLQKAIEIISKATNDAHTIECFRSGWCELDYQTRKAERRTRQDYEWLMTDIQEAKKVINEQLSNLPRNAESD